VKPVANFLVVLSNNKRANVQAGHLDTEDDYVVLQDQEGGRTVAVLPKDQVMVVVDAALVSGALAES
jgi:hypothetical protein